MAFTDDELLAQMKLQQESPDDPRQRRATKQVFAKSEYNASQLREKVGEKVWVRCISDAKPWANDQPMEFWKEYEVSVEDAVSLDSRRFAVVLHSNKALNSDKAAADDAGEEEITPAADQAPVANQRPQGQTLKLNAKRS